jgi:tetratricopeptide (TPR) repeat protein
MTCRVLIFVCLSLCVSVSAYAQEEMSFAAEPVEEDADAKAELTEAVGAYKRDDFLRASLLLYRLLERTGRGAEGVLVGTSAQKAQYFLGKTLYRLGLYQASLGYFDRVVEQGLEHRYFKPTCKWLYYLSRKISGDPGLLKRIAKFRPDDCPVEFRSEIAFLLGQYHYQRGAVKTSLDFLSRVTPMSGYFPKAKFLEGISYVRLRKPKEAVASFKDLLRATIEASEVSEDLRYFNQLAILSMARVFYSTTQFDKAAKYYDQISMDSTLWLDALFESSWTFFRWNKPEKALGQLHTLNSPYFIDEYLPEAPILEAVVFYSNCKYDKARDALERFNEIYAPLRDELRGYLDSFQDPVEFYDFLGKLQDSGTLISPRVSQILSAAFGDKKLKRLNAYIRELDRELASIRQGQAVWSKSRLASTIVQDVQVIKSLAVNDAGVLARKRLMRVTRELDDLFQQYQTIQFELISQERTSLERELANVKVSARKIRKKKIRPKDDEHVYFPFTGEYWRDELGYYLYNVQSECAR